MPATTVGLSLNYGIPGTVSFSGPDQPVVEQHPLASNSANATFGTPLIQQADNSLASATSTTPATLTATNFAGVAVAIVKQQRTYPSGSTPAGYYAPYEPTDVVKKGIVSVTCGRGTPTAGGTVYVRTALNGSFPTAAIGDFEASSDSTNSVALTNAKWHSNRIDANKVAQLKILTINN